MMGGFSVINVGNGLDIEVYRCSYGHNREHGHSVDHEWPLNGPPWAVDRVEQCAHTLEEQDDDDPYNNGLNGQGRWVTNGLFNTP